MLACGRKPQGWRFPWDACLSPRHSAPASPLPAPHMHMTKPMPLTCVLARACMQVALSTILTMASILRKYRGKLADEGLKALEEEMEAGGMSGGVGSGRGGGGAGGEHEGLPKLRHHAGGGGVAVHPAPPGSSTD